VGSFAGAAGHTISLYSFSKVYGFASWRVGYMVFPAVLRDAFRKIQDTNLICPPVVSQLAALGCLRAGDAWIEERVAEIAIARKRVLEGLQDLGDLVRVTPAPGAFYFLIDVKTDMNSLDLTRRLIAEHRVAVIPGSAFGFTDGCALRIAYGALTAESVAEGMGRLVTGLRSFAASRK
jgi:aspartate/methionine/tyrosine aminotransferase